MCIRDRAGAGAGVQPGDPAHAAAGGCDQHRLHRRECLQPGHAARAEPDAIRAAEPDGGPVHLLSLIHIFRIDHDEKFNETTHAQYSFSNKHAPWAGINWRYDSGLVAGSAPCYNVVGANTLCTATSISIGGQPGIDLSGLTPDQQFEAGLACNGVKATPSSGFTQCLVAQYSSSLLSIPAPNTEDDDKNPPRIAPRNVFDASFGVDNLLAGDKQKWSLRLTAVNVTNKYALYNFLSTFSGTHYLTPRALTGEVAYHF